MSNKTILVAGGAGYIGSHFCHVAASRGFQPVVIDRVGPASERVAAYRRGIGQHFPLEVCDIADEARIGALVARHSPVAAVCFAALIEVAQSVADPPLYWDANFVRPMRFFRSLAAGGVRHLVFSSTAAVYDASASPGALRESARLGPASPYGATKLACELMLQGASASHQLAPGLRFDAPAADWPPLPSIPLPERAAFAPAASLIFRYFNAAGADPAAGLGEVHEPESHLVPNAIAAVQSGGRVLTIYGDDYPTPDGTCVRDYVHVLDLAEAHVSGLEYLLGGGNSDVINLGCGSGYSIRQVIAAVEEVAGARVAARQGPRRGGDLPRLVADVGKARDVLGWTPRRGLRDIVASAMEFHRREG